MINRKSQAALEFIMTYGWAILVVLVAVGALAYFGVLSPDKFLPSKCTLQSGIACLDHRATTADIEVRLQNSLGFDIDTIVVKAEGCGIDNDGPLTLTNGGQGTYTITCGGSLGTSGSRYSGQLNVSYRVTDTLISHNNVGEITTRLE